MPSINSDFDKFSWKYFQSLPLGKKDLVLVLLVTIFFCRLIWLLSFLEIIVSFFQHSNTVVSISTYFKCLLAGLPMIGVISLLSIKQIILHPRRKYSQTNQQFIFLMVLRNMIIMATVLFYGSTTLSLIFGISEKTIMVLAVLPFALLFLLSSSWFFSPALVGVGYVFYKRTLKVRRLEELGYSKPRNP